jgi:uroporphyrin-III C-methyltransferase/precorrin-2 dehydrogenase/sirohydrochlorin ferrochelatase
LLVYVCTMNDTANRQPETGYPVFLQLRNRPVLVIGGDETAVRKTRRLLSAGAQVNMIFEQAVQTIIQWTETGRVRHLARQFDPSMVDGHCLVLVADAPTEVLAAVTARARERGIPINVVDRPEFCTALVPAIVDRSPVMIAIGTGGRAPELARMIRSRLEQLLPGWLGPLAALADAIKSPLRQKFPEPARRRQFLDWLFNDTPARAIENGQPDQALQMALDALEHSEPACQGSVALVGAGPGDPELLTLRALRLIQAADIIVHDGLVDPRIFEYARRDAELIDVTKRRGYHRATQEDIQAILVDHARRGARVVRLKGGDPMVFGRGGEELEDLRSHGIDYQVVPGVTAAVACAAYAGFPLTHRDHAQSVRLVTAHCKDSIDRLDWSALANEHQTLAFYMAVAQLERIQARLIAHGRSRSTPIAIVENGTRPNQRVLSGSLSELVCLARSNHVQSPAILYIGSVAALCQTLAWYGDQTVIQSVTPSVEPARVASA